MIVSALYWLPALVILYSAITLVWNEKLRNSFEITSYVPIFGMVIAAFVPVINLTICVLVICVLFVVFLAWLDKQPWFKIGGGKC